MISRTCFGAGKEEPADSPLRQDRSRNILLYSDIPSRDARQTLTLLESRLRRLARYWSCPLRTPIECVLVDNSVNWNSGLLDSDTQVTLERVGGFAEVIGTGNTAHARVYTTNNMNVAVHELVHAYCATTFHSAPPAWYKEGMAEYFANRVAIGKGLQGSEEAFRVLQATNPRTLKEVTSSADFTANIAAAVRRASQSGGSGWLGREARDLKTAKESYYWSWLLCHFLAENENYKSTFQQFGIALREGNAPEFDRQFHDLWHRLEIEFEVFARTCQPGYQVRPASFRWPRTPAVWKSESRLHLALDRGFQASGFLVAEGAAYRCEIAGTSGASQRVPRDQQCEAIVINAEGAGVPFRIDGDKLIAPSTGHLFLRIAEDWSSLNRNKGEALVQISSQ